MNVHITCTPDFSEETLDNVISTLESTKGVINFQKSEIYDEELSPDYLEGFNDKFSLTNNEFFQICEKYRRGHKKTIDKDDYFVLISDKPHSDNWFSAFREKNIFIIGSDWDNFTNKDYRYPIAFQIVENLFQTLCNLKIEGKVGDNWNELPFNQLDPNIHMERTTCVNGMCEYKSWISDKFIAGYICESCYDRAEREIQDSLVLDHIELLLKDLRDEFVKRGDRPERVLLPLKVDETGDIFIGDINIKMQDLEKCLYLYFVKNENGIHTSQICTKEIAINVTDIYKKLRKGGKIESVAKVFGFDGIRKIEDYDKVSDSTSDKRFYQLKSYISNAIKEKIGEAVLNYYKVDKVTKPDGNYFKISLERDKIYYSFK